MNQFFVIARQALQKNLPPSTVIELIVLEVPRLLLLTIPMGVLLGVLVGLGRLSADCEITALRASGVSYLRMARPVVTLGLLGTAAGLLLYHMVGPWAHAVSTQLTESVLSGTNLNLEIRPRVLFDSLPGTILYAEEVDPGDSEWPLRGVVVRTVDPEGREHILLGTRGRVDRDRAAGRLVFNLDRGELHVLDPASPEAYSMSRFEEPFARSFALPDFTGGDTASKKGTADMTLAELDELMTRRTERVGGASNPDDFIYRKAAVEKAQRTAVPFSALGFALLALPLGIVSRRSGRSSGFALSLLVIVGYWVGFSVLRGLALDGTLKVLPAIWTMNVLLGGAALLLILLRQRFELLSPGALLKDRTLRLLARLPGPRTGIARSAGEPLAPPPSERDGAGSRLIPGFLLLDRYVARRFLSVLALVILGAFAIVWVVFSRNALESMSGGVADPGLLLRYVAFSSPGAVWYLLPVSCMLAAMTALALLERRSELTAMKAAGVSLYRVAIPILSATAAVCLLYLGVQEYLAPMTNREALRLEDRMEGRTATVQPGTRWVFGNRRLLYGYAGFDPETKTFGSLEILDFSEPFDALRHRVCATDVRWDGSRWVAASGWSRQWREEGVPLPTDRYTPIAAAPVEMAESPALFIRREQSFLRGTRLPDEMSAGELQEYLGSAERRGTERTPLEVAFWAKTAFPFTPLVMVLLGLPFAFRTARKGPLTGIGVALGLIALYWAVFAMCNALGLEGVVAPIAAAWVPNTLFTLAGLYMLLSVRS